MHTFIGLRIPIEISKELFDFGNKLKGKIQLKQWTYLDDLHITLKFIGETSEDTLKLLMEKINDIKYDKINVKITGIDTFGNPKTPRVVYFGLDYSNELIELHKVIQILCKDLGLKLDPKPFKPHITIAKKWAGDQGEIFNRDIIEEINRDFREISLELRGITLFGIYPKEKPKYKTLLAKDLI
ncbi:MAG: transporter permease [Bacillales bacterium]|nr:transporter permease [Bacillales bacterium]